VPPKAAKAFIMFYVYILVNDKKRHYIGYTNCLESRLLAHNSNKVRATKNKGPWEILCFEEYQTKSEAYKRELQIKNYKGGNAFKLLIAERCPSG
jgi:putative endonuclease